MSKVITEFTRIKDSSVWIKQGETDIFRYKSYNHSLEFLSKNREYKESKIENKEIIKKPELKVNKESITINAWITSDKWIIDKEGRYPAYQVRRITDGRVFVHGYPDRVNFPIHILRLSNNEELNYIPGNSTGKTVNMFKPIKEVEKIKGISKVKIKEVLEECAKKDFDESDEIFKFIKKELEIK